MRGKVKTQWTKEKDDLLLNSISDGKNLLQLTIIMNMDQRIIRARLKEMGFEDFRDARRVMTEPIIL